VVVAIFVKNGGTFFRVKEIERPPMVYLRSAEQLRIYQGGGQMDYSRIARKLRDKIARFSGELSRGLSKVSKRFVREMVYGIQASQSVVLTKIARTLEEKTGGAAVTATAEGGIGAEDSEEPSEDGLCACGERYVTDFGSKRHTEEVCKEDGVFGHGA
jgi:hypothetical protein